MKPKPIPFFGNSSDKFIARISIKNEGTRDYGFPNTQSRQQFVDMVSATMPNIKSIELLENVAYKATDPKTAGKIIMTFLRFLSAYQLLNLKIEIDKLLDTHIKNN